MHQGVDDRETRIARNEAAFRQTNETIGALNEQGAQLPAFHVVCECGSTMCVQSFPVAAGEYEAVRAHGDRFLVISGHEALDVESVVERNGGFVVVEKHAGRPQALAEATDPRADDDANAPSMARQIAENEARFRDANERIERAVRQIEPEALTLPFVCECGRPRCMKILRLTIDEYELARTDPRFFVCSPGHEIVSEGIGRVVQTSDKFVIVEKLGEAGAVAEDLYPRS